MLKVLIIMTTNLDNSGITEMVLRYFNNIDRNKIRFDFVIPNTLNQTIEKELKEKNSSHFTLKSRKKNPLKYMSNLIEIIKNGKYDIVHVHGNSATMFLELMAAQRAGVKVRIAHVHNTTCTHKIINKMLMPIFNRYVTTGFACGIKAGKWLFNKKQFYVIPNANNLMKYQYSDYFRKKIRTKYKIQDKLVIGHIGRFNNQKNHEFLINVFYKYLSVNKNTFLILIGSGANVEKIKRKVNKLGIQDNVLFTGEIKNVHEWLSALDLLLLPSKYEGFPVTLIESQNSCLPAIVSNKVSPEVKITDLIYFEKISEIDSVNKWVQKIDEVNYKNRNEDKIKNLNLLKNGGFDIIGEANKLTNLYIKLYEEMN